MLYGASLFDPSYRDSGNLCNPGAIRAVIAALEGTRAEVMAVSAVSRGWRACAQDHQPWRGLTFVSRDRSCLWFQRSRRTAVCKATGTWDVRYSFDVSLDGDVDAALLQQLQFHLDACPGIDSLSLHDGEAPQDALEDLVAIATLRALSIHRCEGIESLAHFSTYAARLEVLELCDMSLPISPGHSAVDRIDLLPNLSRLVLRKLQGITCNPTEERQCFGNLADCASLTELDMSENEFVSCELLEVVLLNREGESPSRAGEHLRVLQLNSCRSLRSVRFMSFAPCLAEMHIVDCTGLRVFDTPLAHHRLQLLDASGTDFPLQFLPALLPRLESLLLRRINGVQLSDTTFVPLAVLRRLDLSEMTSLAGLQCIDGCITITELSLAALVLPPDAHEVLQRLLHCGSLALLDLSYCRGTPALHVIFAQDQLSVPSLRSLNIGGAASDVDDEMLATLLLALPELRHLDLSCAAGLTSITPIVAHLRIETLSLNLTGISSEELARLADAPQLRMVSLFGVTHPSLRSAAGRALLTRVFEQRRIALSWDRRVALPAPVRLGPTLFRR